MYISSIEIIGDPWDDGYQKDQSEKYVFLDPISMKYVEVRLCWYTIIVF